MVIDDQVSHLHENKYKDWVEPIGKNIGRRAYIGSSGVFLK